MNLMRQMTVYRLDDEAPLDAGVLARALDGGRFAACAPTQATSAGWVPPRGGAHDPLLEVVAGQWLMRLRIEQRLLPASVVRDHAQALASRVEAETGRRPGKRQLRELKDQAAFELLPQAFTRQLGVDLWLAPKARWLAIDSTASARLDLVLSALAAAQPALKPHLVQTTRSPASAMADWLASDEPPPGWTIDQDCELKSPDERRAVVRYTRHALDGQGVARHLQDGLRPTRLALTWDDRVSLQLTETLQLKRVTLLQAEGETQAEDAFDADWAIVTGELGACWAALVEALDGELAPGSAAAS